MIIKQKKMSSAINNHDYTSYHLPRGYFKRRKPPDENDDEDRNNTTCQPSLHRYSDSLRCRFSDKGRVNKNFLLSCTLVTLILTIMINGVAGDDRLRRALEDNALHTTPVPSTLPNDGICGSVDARFDLEKIHTLAGCRVVEGSVTILLMDELTEKEVENITFPHLVEITGYLMLYRINGFTSLNQLFPNLAVIRGKDLFKNYALIIYEMLNLMEVGLKNLLEVERGNVRIEKNEQMCFTHTIAWQKIAKFGDPYLEKNKLPAHCPKCPLDKCPKSPDGKSSFCWDVDHCQRICSCPENSCSPNGSCCDKSCIGGCEDDNPKKCTACRKYSMGKYPDIKCVDQCPDGTFAYLERRCLTRDECFELNTSNSADNSVSSSENPFIPFGGNCIRECPSKYTKTGTGNQMTCKPCNETCLKRCIVKNIVDSIETANALKGCSIIDGPLEIQIRGTAKSPELGKNIVRELEASLSDIVEINDYLKIARSHPILSLSFLKNLKKIRGNRLESGRNALVVWENHNLEELWDEKQDIEILNGKLFFHFNPRLCFNKIEQLARQSIRGNMSLANIIENYDTASRSNGDKTPCNVTPLNVTVEYVYPQAALLSWDPLHLHDERALLNYVVFYIAAPYANVTLWEGRDACGNDGWSVEDVNDFSHIDKISQPLTKLEPYTQYAYYVKAYTLVRESGAQSSISYFTTKPDQPDLVKKLKATPLGPDRISVTWEKLKKVNGRLKNYILRAKAVDQNENLRMQRDYCKEPLDTTPSQPTQKEVIKDTPKLTLSVAPDGTCDCKSCSLKCDKQVVHNVEDRESANDFEDQIQDFVYVRHQDNDFELPKESRAKRQVDNEFPENQVVDVPTPHQDHEVYRNLSDFYDSDIDPEVTHFEINTGLKHYTKYSITIRACREREQDEDADAVVCGHEVSVYSTTFREPSFDDIKEFKVEQMANGSHANIRVTLKPPEDPNGLLLTFSIRYKRVDIENSGQTVRCYSYNKSSAQSFVIPNLPPGNYSFDVMATSLAGNGNYTKPQYVLIKENPTYNMWYFVFILLFVFLICLLILFYFFKRMYITSISSMKIIATVNPDYAGVTYRIDEWEIPRDKIIQLQELGCGSFGMVYEGIIKDYKRPGEEIRCAIKTVNESATDKERISFLNEASVMKQFDTQHVVHLLGVVSQGQPIFVIMELMANGDLKGYLRSHRPEYDNGTDPPPQPPTLRRILQMAIEIADGMAYLSAKKFVHRDLAARNCMVAEDLTVKIGDFGMTRDIYETDYYRKGTKGLLPVRWMAPESLKDGVFSSSSDVFSYGVVVWEMATLASQPYQGLSNDQVLRYVIEGGVMERPENCPDKLYELMRRCWQHRPSARPSFMDIIGMLLDDVSSNFQNVSFYHSPAGQDAWHQMNQGELAVLVTDDVTTPLRQDEETSSIDGNHFLMEEVNSNHHHLDDL